LRRKVDEALVEKLHDEATVRQNRSRAEAAQGQSFDARSRFHR
jgi:hypothetical protein